MATIQVLATDMDGTFIPLQGDEDNRQDLQRLTEFLASNRIELVYVTGRHFDLVMQAIETERLPTPDWIICDVGASIFHRSSEKGHVLLETYATHLSEIVTGCDVQSLRKELPVVDGMRLQEPEKQGRHKLSYYCGSEMLEKATDTVLGVIRSKGLPYHLISSVDPFTHAGLIDLLPYNVTKAYALDWWTKHVGHPRDAVIFAGDSGNDFAALTAGYSSIVVSNAADDLRKKVQEAHLESGFSDLLFNSLKPATSGVLEGVTHFAARPEVPNSIGGA